ncbi:MAG: RNA polymerase sigma factor [Bacteroidota bacterium]
MNSEEILAREVRKNKPGAVEALYDRYAPMLLGICMRYCGNRQDAEDVLHDGFIKILKHLYTFKARSSGSFEGWIRRIIVNTALNFLRDHSQDRRFLEIDTVRERISDEADEDDSWGDLNDQIGKEEIMGMICGLPSGYRAVFNLYVFEGYSHKEIAEQLHFSESTSKSQLSKARVLLRKKISEVMEKQKVV